ncbi:unnamed protein product [Caenorhabditis nigoni]
MPRVSYPNRKPIPIREIPVQKAEPGLDWSILDRLNRSIRSPTADDLNIPMHSRSPSPLEAVTSSEGPTEDPTTPSALETVEFPIYEFPGDFDQFFNTKTPENLAENSQKSTPTNIADALQDVLANSYHLPQRYAATREKIRFPANFNGVSRIDGPDDVAEDDGAPIPVNPRQFVRILRRREMRGRQEDSGVIPVERQAYLYESRHQHALSRVRLSDGRFDPAARKSLGQQSEKVPTQPTLKRQYTLIRPAHSDQAPPPKSSEMYRTQVPQVPRLPRVSIRTPVRREPPKPTPPPPPPKNAPQKPAIPSDPQQFRPKISTIYRPQPTKRTFPSSLLLTNARPVPAKPDSSKPAVQMFHSLYQTIPPITSTNPPRRPILERKVANPLPGPSNIAQLRPIGNTRAPIQTAAPRGTANIEIREESSEFLDSLNTLTSSETATTTPPESLESPLSGILEDFSQD